MANPPVDKQDAERFFTAIEEALTAGWAPPGKTRNKKGAIYVACESLGINTNSGRSHLAACKAVLGRDPDWSTWTEPAQPECTIPGVPDGYYVKGTSTLYDPKTGEAKLEWVKTGIDQERQKALFAAMVASIKKEVPRVKPVPLPKSEHRDKLLNCYVITDYHMGMLAWPDETGEAWDIKIAEKLILDWFSMAIAQAPKAQVGILGQLGDLLHWDGMEAVTPTSRHILDADTRFQRLVHVVIKCLLAIIRMMLTKYPAVHIIMADANHDPASSVWLREFLSIIYENEPRITVDTNPDSYYCYEHGDVSLFFHHGHYKKPAEIDDVFVAKYRDVFGRTKFSYAHMGHLHHLEVKETNLMVVEQHRTLAAKDAFSSRRGYMAGRSASVITYHKEYGEVGRVTISPEMVT